MSDVKVTVLQGTCSIVLDGEGMVFSLHANLLLVYLERVKRQGFW
jgi:hypothetical protein